MNMDHNQPTEFKRKLFNENIPKFIWFRFTKIQHSLSSSLARKAETT